MLVFSPTQGEKSSYWVLRASYLARKHDLEFGRVDCCDPTDGAGQGLVSIRGETFECRVHITGKGRWAHVPADWVMYRDGAIQHVARPESGRRYLVEGGGDQPPLRLRLEGLGARFAIEPATERMRIGEMIWTRAALVPRPRQAHMVLQTTPELPERLSMFLAWVGLQHWLRLTRE